ncbi:ribbon-helix-helix protein, CopG family [uncultured Microbacterium sp.]|uniref:ribbon-helix-helix protein, CopG family n=1 Tax=uncultured Microbacterium sp. TaxID=191216 RepID=UPI0035CA5740
MAMTLRIPAELDARLDALAAERRTSKHALIIEATDRFVSSQSKTARVLSAIDEVGDRYSDALTRLEDA